MQEQEPYVPKLTLPNALPDISSEDASGKRRRRHRPKTVWGKLRRRIRKSFRWNLILGSALVIVVVVVVTLGVLATDAGNQLRSSWENLNRILVSITGRSGTELTLNDLNRLQSGLRELRSRLDLVSSRAALVAPVVNSNADGRALLQMLRVAQDLTAATDAMLDGIQPTLFFMVQGADEAAVATRISSGQRMTELLEIGRGRFSTADSRLQSARQTLQAIDLSGVSSQILLNIEQLTEYVEQVDSINQLLLNAPDLITQALGLDTPTTYLVLAQNNDELRPSGGYISTWGWLVLRNSRIDNYNYSATTTTSPNPPPRSFADSFTIPAWWIQYSEPIFAAWDGSWYADFSRTARKAAEYYSAGRNPFAPAAGVIGIDITGFEYVLGVLGRVSIPEYNTFVTAENFRDVVYDIRAFGEANEHKRFVATVYREIFSNWQRIDEAQSSAMLGALLRGMQEKHVMLYFDDPELQEAVELLGWAGTQPSPIEQDYLLIADANLGNKSNISILRQITYDANIREDGSVESRLSISYDYPAALASQDPAVDAAYHGPLDYRNLLQIFVPEDTVLLEADAVRSAQVISDAGRSIFVTSFVLAYDSSERLQYRYETPPLVTTIGDFQRYELLVQKQPGSRIEPLTVQLRLPANAEIVSVSPPPAATYSLEQPILDFRLTLNTDQTIEVIYR